MRAWCAGAAALLAACPSGPHESDVVLAEVKAPLHARIMQREHEEPVDCSGISGLAERVGCIFRSNTTTCEWLEIDTPELAARPFGTSLASCSALGRFGTRVTLPQAAAAPWELVADPSGGRLAFRAGTAGGTVLYVLDGVVVGSAFAPWPVSWSSVPKLEDRLTMLFEAADDETSARLLAWAEKVGGDERVVELMGPIAEASVDRWFELYERIEDAALKERALAALHARLREDDVPVGLVTGLIAYPELQPDGYVELLGALATLELSGYPDWYTLEPMLTALAERKAPLAGELACRVYGMQVLSSMPQGVDVFYEEAGDPEMEAGALELIARLNAPCPWVKLSLDAAPCSEALRCQVDGGLPDDEMGEDDPFDPVTGEPIYVGRPLCSSKVAAAAVARAGRERGDDDEVLPDAALTGPLLLGVGYAQGAVSKELVQRNARRMYRYQYPKVSAPLDEEEGEYDEEEPPCSRPRNLPEAVCRLPVSVNEIVFNNCRVRIDDKAQVVRVDELKPK